MLENNQTYKLSDGSVYQACNTGQRWLLVDLNKTHRWQNGFGRECGIVTAYHIVDDQIKYGCYCVGAGTTWREPLQPTAVTLADFRPCRVIETVIDLNEAQNN